MFPTECERCKISSSMEGCLRTSAVEIAVSDASYPDSSVGGQAPCGSRALAQFASGCGWLLSDTPTSCQVCCWRPAQLWEAVEPTASTPAAETRILRVRSLLDRVSEDGNVKPVIRHQKLQIRNLRTKYFSRGDVTLCFQGLEFFSDGEAKIFFILVLFSFISPLTLPLIASHGIV